MPLRQVRDVMGMPVTIHVADDKAAASLAVDEAFADFVLLDRTFSPFRGDSLVSRINRGELRLSESGALVLQAVELSRHYEHATRGYFSAWPGGCLDPSGLVKGWAIDRASSILDRHGCRRYFIDAGGKAAQRGGYSNPDSHDRESYLLNKSQGRTSMSMPWTRRSQVHAAPASARRVPPSRS